ncbi:MAG TPA: tetratricopeptide repeat protein [Gemmatimonadaceae bacterium]|nr:tetratricopeptide repeat protein [Gemmatimonadaceae bacterium]
MRGLLLGVLLATLPAALDAQRRSDTRRIRAEYAGVLLQSKKYDQAITEYRRLIAAEPNRFEYRMGLARALAWSKRHRDAENELSRLRALRPGHAEVEQLTRTVRAALDPSSGEARSWVAHDPGHLPYRIQLARAYAREGKSRQAADQFDTIFRSGARDDLAQEAASANADAKRFATALPLYRRAIARAPSDTALRHDYARALWSAGDRQMSLAQYDTLLLRFPSPAWLVERARLRVALRDHDGAERDLASAIAMRPTAEAYFVRGELRRWNGELGAARAEYERALQLAGNDSAGREIRDLIALIEREARPALGAAPEGDVAGWVGRAELAADNTGFSYASAGGRYGLPLGRLAAVSIGIEQRRVAAKYDLYTRESYGFGADLGATLGLPFARLSARAGMLRHGGATETGYGSVGVIGWWRSWRASAEVKRELAFPHLMTARALATSDDLEPDQTVDASIVATRQIYGLAGAVGVVDFGLVADIMRLSDGNARPAFTTTVRYPLGDALSALYVASDVRFAERSAFYWDPDRYMSHSLGMEASARRDRGLSYVGRVLTGFARTSQLAARSPEALDGATEASYAFHGAAEGELTYRASGWDAGLTSWYGRGREGGYQRWGGSFRIRLSTP